MSEVEVEAGATVITLDDYGSAIYFIEQGEADVLSDGGEANQTLGPVRTSNESDHVYLSLNARCAASALSVRAGRRTGLIKSGHEANR